MENACITTVITTGASPRMTLQLLDQVEGFDAAKWRDSEDGSSVLHLSVASGRLELLELLLERGCDADATDLKGRTPLCIACTLGGLDFVKVVMEHGADMQKTIRKCTWDVHEEGKVKSMVVEYIQPLTYALLGDHTEIVNYLLEQGARANSTTLAMALEKGLDTVKRLLAAGTEGRIISEFYRGTVILATRSGLGEILVTLLHAGPQFLPGDLQDTVVIEAVKYDHLSVVRALYEAGWRPGSVKLGMMLMNRAMELPQSQILEYLLLTVGSTPDGCITLEAHGEVKLSPVHAACQLRNLESLSLFIWAGANVDATDTFGLTPLAYALHGAAKQPQIKCRYLRYCGGDPTRVCLSPDQRKILGITRPMVNPAHGQPQGPAQRQAQEEEYQRVVRGIEARVKARVKARWRSPSDFFHLLRAVRSAPKPLVSQKAVDRCIDTFYRRRDAAAQQTEDNSMICDKQAGTCPLSSLQVVTRDSVVAADGGVYERAAIKKWIEECFQEDGVIMSPTTGQVMSSTILLPALAKNLAPQMPAYQPRYHQYTPKQRPGTIEVSASSCESTPRQHSPLASAPASTSPSPSPKSRESPSHCPPSGMREDCLPPAECRPTHHLYYSPPSLFIIPEDNEASDYPSQERSHRFRWPTSGYRRSVQSTVTKDYKWNEQHQRVGSLGTRSIIGEVSVTKNVTVTTTTTTKVTTSGSNAPSTATYHRAVRSTLTKDFSWNEQHQRVGSLGTRSIIGEVSVLSSMWGKNNQGGEKHSSSKWGLGRRSPLVGRASA